MKKQELKKIIKETILKEMGEGLFTNEQGEEQPSAPVNFTDEDLAVVDKYGRKLQEFQRLWARFTNSNLSVNASKVLRNAPQSNEQTMWSSNLRSTNTSLFNLSTAVNELSAQIKTAKSPYTPAAPEPQKTDVNRLTRKDNSPLSKAKAVAPQRVQAPTPRPVVAPSRPVRQAPTGRE